MLYVNYELICFEKTSKYNITLNQSKFMNGLKLMNQKPQKIIMSEYQNNILNQEQIDFLNKYVEGTWTVNDQGLIDVDGSVNCRFNGLTKLPVQFGSVSGNFYCYGNQLTTLEGAPFKIGGNFGCHRNQLTSLQGAPSKVGGYFYCYGNQLTTLQGAPSKIGGDFVVPKNRMKDKEYIRWKIKKKLSD